MSAGVVIVGAGLAAQRCCETLRAGDGTDPSASWATRSTRPTTARRCPRACSPARPRPATSRCARGLVRRARRRARPRRPGDGARPRRERRSLLAGGAGCATTHWSSPPAGCRGCSPASRARNVHVLRTLDDALALRAALRRRSPRRRRRRPRRSRGRGHRACAGRRRHRRRGRPGAARGGAGRAHRRLAGRAAQGGWRRGPHGRGGRGRAGPVRASARSGLGDGRRVACDTVLVAVGMVPATAGWTAAGCLPVRSPPTPGAHRSCRMSTRPATCAEQATGRRPPARGPPSRRRILGVPAPAAPPAAFWSDQHGVRLQFAGTAAGHDRVVVDGDPTRRRRPRPLPARRTPGRRPARRPSPRASRLRRLSAPRRRPSNPNGAQHDPRPHHRPPRLQRPRRLRGRSRPRSSASTTSPSSSAPARPTSSAAAEACPAVAISVVDEATGRQLYP